MIAHSVGDSVKTTLKNHIVKYNTKQYMQFEGAVIAVGVAGDVVDLFKT